MGTRANDDWVSSLPDNWSSLPLKRLADIESSGSYGAEEDVLEYNLPVCTTATVLPNGKFNLKKMPIRSFSAKDVERYQVIPDDILVVKSSGSAANIISGKSAIADTSVNGFIYTNFLMRLRTRKLVAKYLSYFLKSQLVVERIKKMVSTTTYPNINVNLYASQAIFFPQNVVQKKIIDFLDTETAKIDDLIAKQEKLLKLLVEKQRTTITHAITHGLDPNVELKETKIPWLGKAPVQWEIVRAKYIFRKVQERPFVDDEVVTAFRDGEVVLRKLRREDGFTFADKEIGYQHVDTGDLVIHAMDGFAGAVGVSKSNGKMSPVCSICKPVRKDIDTNYFAQLIRTMTSTNYLIAIAKGIRERSTDFRFGDFGNMTFPIPPLPEQIEIVKYINRINEESKMLKQKVQTHISLLRERRTTLISHAITGRIRV